MISIIGVSVISAVLYLVVKKYSPEYAVLIEIASIVLVVWTAYPYLCDVIDFYMEFSASGSIDGDYLKLILKVSGAALITQFSADICRDSGESALASKVEFAGKTLILALSLPLTQALLEFATGLIK
ncbi:MAG: hypothetical protein IJZ35_04070 [Clostridia bacterium]|nr:hypothetical protein [Clostridia bacterium]